MNLLAYDGRIILIDLGDGEANVLTTVNQALEMGVLSVADILGAFDQVAGDERANNLVRGPFHDPIHAQTLRHRR